MKYRKGFVSNSSSTSFIIDANKYTCADVAREMAFMIYCCDWEGTEYDPIEHDPRYKVIEKNLENFENKNASMYIHTGSDDVEIHKEDENIYVSATRNKLWYERLDISSEYEEGTFWDKFKGVKWYFPEFDNKFIGEFAPYSLLKKYKDKQCDCNVSFIKTDKDIIYCPKCKKGPDGKPIAILMREEKLKRVTK